MAIDGFDFNTIVNGRIDPDSPLDTTLFNDLRDQSEFLQRWLGKSFIGAAVADHNHDGANSKKIIAADITGSINDSSSAQFSTTTGTPSFSVNIAHNLGRTPASVWGFVTIEFSDVAAREFRFHWTPTRSEVEGKAWNNTFGDLNEHPEQNNNANEEFSQSTLSGDEIANDSDTNVASPSTPARNWRINSVDATNIELQITTPDVSGFRRLFYFMAI